MDATDAVTLGQQQPSVNGFQLGSSSSENVIADPVVSLELSRYAMNHRRTGFAYLFNHKTFYNDSYHSEIDKTLTRHGSTEDMEKMEKVLSNLGFDVKCFLDLSLKDIRGAISKLAKKNHSDHDCVLVVVSSHGYEGDRIMASDKLNYHSSELWAPFTSDKCRSLASKPKLFFIQACRGVNTDKGNPVRASSLTSKDALVAEFSIPTQADFLFVYSTVPGYVSYRNELKGTPFLQNLCSILEKRGQSEDLLSMMTVLLREVSTSKGDYSQMPVFTTQLLHLFFFTKKISTASWASWCSFM